MKVIAVRTFCSVPFSCRQKWIMFSPPLFLCAQLFDAFRQAALPIETATHVRELSGGGGFFFVADICSIQNAPPSLAHICEGRDVYVTNKCYESDVFLRGEL